MSHQIDSPGHGLRPWLSQPTLVGIFTQGGETVSMQQGVLHALSMPRSKAPGASLFVDPFRWDTRLFTVLLPNSRDAGTSKDTRRPAHGYLEDICRISGGKLYQCRSVRHTKSVGVWLCCGPYAAVHELPHGAGESSRS